MIDTKDNKRLIVSSEDAARPYIIAPVAQLDQVKALLDSSRVSYWVDEEVLSIDGNPEIAFINLRQGSDPTKIQKLLDSIS